MNCQSCGIAVPESGILDYEPFMVQISIAIWILRQDPFGAGRCLQPSFAEKRLCLACGAPALEALEKLTALSPPPYGGVPGKCSTSVTKT